MSCRLPRILSTVFFQFLTIDAPKQWILPRRPSLVTKTCLVARRVPFAVLPRRVVTRGPSHASSLVLPLPSRWATKIIGVARRVSRRGPLAASQTRALRVAITASPVGGEFVFAGTSDLKTARRLIGVTFSSRGECDCCSSSKDDNHLDHAKARQSQDAQAKQGDPTLGLSMEDGNRVVELIRAQEQARIHADNMARMKSKTSSTISPVCDTVLECTSDAAKNGETCGCDCGTLCKYLAHDYFR